MGIDVFLAGYAATVTIGGIVGYVKANLLHYKDHVRKRNKVEHHQKIEYSCSESSLESELKRINFCNFRLQSSTLWNPFQI